MRIATKLSYSVILNNGRESVIVTVHFFSEKSKCLKSNVQFQFYYALYYKQTRYNANLGLKSHTSSLIEAKLLSLNQDTIVRRSAHLCILSSTAMKQTEIIYLSIAVTNTIITRVYFVFINFIWLPRIGRALQQSLLHLASFSF